MKVFSREKYLQNVHNITPFDEVWAKKWDGKPVTSCNKQGYLILPVWIDDVPEILKHETQDKLDFIADDIGELAIEFMKDNDDMAIDYLIEMVEDDNRYAMKVIDKFIENNKAGWEEFLEERYGSKE